MVASGSQERVILNKANNLEARESNCLDVSGETNPSRADLAARCRHR